MPDGNSNVQQTKPGYVDPAVQNCLDLILLGIVDLIQHRQKAVNELE